jgi:predicted CXXCH cytochrome family protein
MKTRLVLLAAFTGAWLLAFGAATSHAANVDAAADAACAKCHPAAAGGKVVHAAVEMGCSTCHVPVDASVVPHRSSGKFPKALRAEGSAVCANCHEAALFTGKVVHAPVEAGQCMGCHDPHASPYQGLLKMEPAKLCLDCHGDIAKGPHVVAGFSRSGHPLGNDKKVVPDPLRLGKTFYCASCHEPHRSTLPKLTRFDQGTVSCQKCHKV